jgi:hypothetical protein
MATPIKIKRSAVAGKRPLVTDLGLGELALNTFDAELVTLRQRAFNHTFVSANNNAVNVQSGAENGNQKTPNGATYIASTGVLTLTFASAHGMSTNDTISLDNESIIFTCDADNYQTNHPYPRATDPIAGVTTAVTVTSSTAFTLNVGQGYSTEVVRAGAGATVTNVWYVTKDGKDDNTGKKLGDAKATIKSAVGSAGEGDVIKVSAGTYTENNPIELPKQVSLVGDSLREVTVVPQNAGSDLFHVAPGNYLSEMSFTGTMNSGSAICAFNPNKVYYSAQSPYISNCTNFVANSIGLKINGSKSIGAFKSMVTDAFTQYNSNGIGVSITNEGYAQIVSMFTINSDVGIAVHSGGQCDVTNSNSSFGNFGLIADGVGPRKYTGIVTSAQIPNQDNFVLNLNTPTRTITGFNYDNVSGLTTVSTSGAHGFEVGMGVTISGVSLTCPYGTKTYPDGKVGYVFEVKSIISPTSFTTNVGVSTVAHTYASGGTVKLDIIRPFDGQVVYFDSLYQEVKKLNITGAGSGYTSPPTITIDAPGTAWGVQATAVASIKNGSIDEITLVSSGRGYTSTPNVTVTGSGTATAAMKDKYYSIMKSTPLSAGITTITVNDNVPYAVGIGSTVPFFKQSRIIASSHSFEYIGTGVDPVNSLPSRGAVPIQDNEVDDRNGGLTIFTSTDQAGQFRIGDGVIIDQQTGTISGNFYSKSLFSTMTPFILALGGD